MSLFYKKSRQNLLTVVCDTRGVTLVVVMGLMCVLLLLAVSAISVVTSFVKSTHQVERANTSYFVAEGGVELALYDLAAYKSGYETSKKTEAEFKVCGDVDDKTLDRTEDFIMKCDDDHQYRFTNFTTEDYLSGARGFWRIFSRTLLDSDNKHIIPNPYFRGDKDGNLTEEEWGLLTKGYALSLSLLIDDNSTQVDPADRFKYFLDGADKKIIFNPGVGWDPDEGVDDKEELMTWTLSAIDGNGVERALQGIIWESDFTDNCDGSGPGGDCFILDFSKMRADVAPDVFSGSAFAGEDINKNIKNGGVCPGNDDCSGDGRLNRVSGVQENFNFNTISEFIEDLNDSMSEATNNQWRDAQFTIGLISTLSETSGITSNSLRYKLVSDDQWADEYTYIIAEGFTGTVKQTIETSFRRGSTIPIFSYVIFQ